MTMRSMPARTKRSTCRSIKGCPCTRSSGFGVESVNGRMRSHARRQNHRRSRPLVAAPRD